jgi:hypothetical protein
MAIVCRCIFVAGETTRQKCGVWYFCGGGERDDEAEVRGMFVAFDDGQTNSFLFHTYLASDRGRVDDGRTNSVLYHLPVWPLRYKY